MLCFLRFILFSIRFNSEYNILIATLQNELLLSKPGNILIVERGMRDCLHNFSYH